MAKKEDFVPTAGPMSPPHNHPPVNHQSSSLPSTPYQHARRLSFDSQTPSLEKAARARSPTTHSESETGLRLRGTGPLLAGCRYETGMAHSRRRIPYSIGGDKLEKASTMPKKFLNPAEEEKLSGDMRELYDRLYPSLESDKRRSSFLEKLSRILNGQWPEGDIKVHVFGSSGNLLCTDESDVDICITTRLKALERTCLLAKALAEHGMERVVCVPHAKVPIVKFWDPELRLACDMNVNNTLALENTRMIKTYVEIDHRVRPLAMIIKHWTRRRILNDAALGGTLSSYTWICMILNFLQTRNPPVLPCLHNRPHQRRKGPDGKLSAFADDLASLSNFGHKNKETLGELLFHFYRRYAHELDYGKYIISIREGTLISKEAKKWHLMHNNRLCVEEPFNTERNLGNTADDISFRGVHLELRRAFDLICEAQLDACMEQYVFPAIEEKIWEKPPPKPAPILTPSHPGRGGRGGYGNRGARHAPNQYRLGQQARRASSATASNRFPSPNLVTQAQTAPKHPLQAQYEQLQLHDQLINEYQYLQAQEHELRRAQAQAQLLQTQGPTPVGSSGQKPTRDQLARSTISTQLPMTAPLQQSHPYYPYPISANPVGSVHAVHTNPSSPSMTPVQPEPRRSTNRSNVISDVSGASLRSHSQPARPYPMNPALINPQALLLNGYTLQSLRQQQQQQLYQQYEAQSRPRHPELQHQMPFRLDPRYEENVPKEYVGYYVHDSPPPRRHPGDAQISRIQAYNDMPYGLMSAPDGLGRLRGPSRSPSPSPSLPSRDRSRSIQSAGSATPGPMFSDRATASSKLRTSGPIIVDGSDAWYSTDKHVGANLSSARGIQGTGNLGREFETDDRAATTEEPARRSSRSGSLVSDLGQQHSPWASIPHDFQRFSESGPSPNFDSLRRPYPQVNGTAPAPAGLRYTKPLANGHGLGISSHGNQSKSPVLSSGGDPVNEDKDSRKPIQTGKPSSEAPKKPYDQPLKPLPLLLSPVREVRTPSPTANRKEDGQKVTKSTSKLAQRYQLQEIPPFSKGTNGRPNKNDPLAEKSNGTVNSTGGNPQVTHPTSNGWQQTTSKKKQKHRSKGSTSLNTSTTVSEALPDNMYERKGG